MVSMSHFNSVVCGPKFTNFFLPNVEGVVVDNGFFQTVDMMICSEDIRDQSRKLSKIAPNFGHFFRSQILGAVPSENCTRVITPDLRHVDWKKCHEYTFTTPEVIVAHTLNFRPNFKFSRLKFFGGTPVPVGVCAR